MVTITYGGNTVQVVTSNNTTPVEIIHADSSTLAINATASIARDEAVQAKTDTLAIFGDAQAVADAVQTSTDNATQTTADKNATNADVVQTTADRTATANDVIQTTADKAQTAQDVIDSSLNADRAETAEASASVHATTAQTESAKLANYNSMTSLERALPTKAEFNAIAEERKANRGGSGFDEWGKHRNSSVYPNVNDGINTYPISASQPNKFFIGCSNDIDSNAVSKTPMPITSVNGVSSLLHFINEDTGTYRGNSILLPNSPTVTHADASNSGMVLNGRNMVDTSSYVSMSGAVLSIDTNRIKITNAGATYGAMYQSQTWVIGQEYTVEAYVELGTSSYVEVRAMNTSTGGGTVIGRSGAVTKDGRVTFKFIATVTTGSLVITNSNTTDGTSFLKELFACPSHELSRSDLVFLETWHEDISEKDFVYPLGNIQYLGADTDGLTGIVAGAFAGKDTYSLFGNWQSSNALVGKGYVWSTMSEANKIKFVSNPENNCYIDGTSIVQVRYRVRVVQGLGDEWQNANQTVGNLTLNFSSSNHRVIPKGKDISIADDLAPFISTSKTFVGSGYNSDGRWELGSFVVESPTPTNAYNGNLYALPIALVHRRNQGAYHPKFNPNGCAGVVRTDGLSSGAWHEYEQDKILNIADSFTDYPTRWVSTGASNGNIATASRRPDGLFYDEVNERDIIDLRSSSHKVQDYKRLLEREFNKAVSGEVRGEEGEWEITDYGTFVFTSITNILHPIGYVTRLNVSGQTIIDTIGTVDTLSNDYIIFVEGNTKYWEAVVSVDGNIVLHPDYGYNVLDHTATNIYKIIVAKKSTRKKSNTLLHCDIIGNPANYYRGQTYTNTNATQSVTTAIGDTVWNRAGDNATYKTTGALQTVTTAVGDTVLIEVASGSTGIGTLNMVYRALTVQASIDLDAEDFTSATNWAEVGMNGYFYKALTIQASIDLALQDYTNATNWEDLGTDWDGAGSWRTGVSGTPLVVGENGEDYLDGRTVNNIKFSKKINSIKLALYSADNGATWTITSPTLDATNNTILDTYSTTNALRLFFYETHTNMTENAVNSEVIELGDIYATNYKNIEYGSGLAQSLINKVSTGTAGTDTVYMDIENRVMIPLLKTLHYGIGLEPKHDAITLGTTISPSVKTLPYITKENNKAYLNLVFKEMKFDVTWNDDSKFNIVDNVSTTVDDGGNTVLIGQKRIHLPYFIGDDE